MFAKVSWRTAVLTAFLIQSPAYAVVLIGNFTPSDSDWNVGVSQTQQPAVSFALSTQSYSVDSVTLDLVNYITGDSTPVVGFYSDNGGQPGLLIGSLLVSPVSNSGDPAYFTFTLAAPLTLAANTTYWLMADSANGDFAWNASSRDTPTSRTPLGAASFGTYKVSVNNGISFIDDSPVPNFSVSATPVPEPSQYAAVAGGALLAFAFWRRRQTRKRFPKRALI